MLDCFYPDQEAGNAYDIEYEELYRQGYRGVIFDIDNTLVPHDAAADGKAKALFHRLRKIGFKTLLLSNNKEPRVKSFCREVQSPYIYRAGKPAIKGYRRAMEMLGTNKENTLFVGDQLFTDVLGAKRADSSQRGDPDRFETKTGADRAVFLSQEKAASEGEGRIEDA